MNQSKVKKNLWLRRPMASLRWLLNKLLLVLALKASRRLFQNTPQEPNTKQKTLGVTLLPKTIMLLTKLPSHRVFEWNGLFLCIFSENVREIRDNAPWSPKSFKIWRQSQSFTSVSRPLGRKPFPWFKLPKHEWSLLECQFVSGVLLGFSKFPKCMEQITKGNGKHWAG